MFFEIGTAPVSSYFGTFSASFLVPIFDCFFFDVGVILGGFWEPKSVIFGINFWMIFACRSKSGPRALKSGPRAPKSAPRAPQERPRAPQEQPREAKRGSIAPQGDL